MKKNYITIGILLLLALGLSWALGMHTRVEPSYVANQEQLILRMVENHSGQHPANEGVSLFAALVEERTAGAVKIILSNDPLLDEASILEQISYGGIDIGRVSGVYLDAYVDEISTLCLPGLYQDNQEMMGVFQDETIGTMIEEALKYEKLNVLTWYPGSTRGIFSESSHVLALDEAKVGIPQSKMKIAEMEAMGFQPIPYNQNSLNGYLDGAYVVAAEGTLLDYYYNRNYNKAQTFTVTASRIPEVIVASNTALMQLTVEQQEILAEAALEAGLMTTEQIAEKEAALRIELEDLGCHFEDLTQEASYYGTLQGLQKAVEDRALLESIHMLIDEGGK